MVSSNGPVKAGPGIQELDQQLIGQLWHIHTHTHTHTTPYPVAVHTLYNYINDQHNPDFHLTSHMIFFGEPEGNTRIRIFFSHPCQLALRDLWVTVAPCPELDSFQIEGRWTFSYLFVYTVHHSCVVCQELHCGVLKTRQEGYMQASLIAFSSGINDGCPHVFQGWGPCKWSRCALQAVPNASVIKVLVRAEAENSTPLHICGFLPPSQFCNDMR